MKIMSVQITKASILCPTSSKNSNAIVGLRRRPSNGYVLKSSFFSPVSLTLFLQLHQRLSAGPPKFSMRVASKQAYICRDCGYIYNERTPFDKQSDNYFCPVCGAPKRRFKPYSPAVNKDANATDVRKARKAQLKRDEAIGNALPFAIVIGLAVLAGLYLYLNNAYQV